MHHLGDTKNRIQDIISNHKDTAVIVPRAVVMELEHLQQEEPDTTAKVSLVRDIGSRFGFGSVGNWEIARCTME